jgi:hypothetical protein
MGMTAVIVVDKGEQSRLEIRHRSEIAPFQKPPRQDTKPQLHLIEPGAMGRGKMEHMLVGRIREKGLPLLACLQLCRNERDLAHFGHDTTDLQAPMGIQVIQDPVKPDELRELAGYMVQVSREVHAGAGRSQVTDDLAGRHDQRGDESARPVSDGVLLTSCGLARLRRQRRVGTAQRLHPRLFITTDQQPALLVHHGCLDVQLANGPSFGVEIRVVTVEPVDATVRFEVSLVKNPPDCRPTHGQRMKALVDQGKSQVIQRPSSGRTTLLVVRAAGQVDHIESFRGGKSVAVVPTVARPAGLPIRSKGSDCATARPCGDHSGIRQQFEDWSDCPCRRLGESAGSGTLEPVEWHAHEPMPPVERAGDRSEKQSRRMGMALVTSMML